MASTASPFVAAPIPLSERAKALKAPSTLAIMAKAKALARQGAPVISFGLGEPDFDTPERIRKAAIAALEGGQTHYMPTAGDPETRGVIADKLARENGLKGVTPEHVVISTGAKQSLYLAFHCLLGGEPVKSGPPAADEVLLPVPAWVSYAPVAQIAGGRVVELVTTAATDFKITPAQLKAAITPRSRILVLNSPSNPCGTMYTPEEMRAIAAVVADAAATIAPNLVIVTDEIYEKIIYGGIPHFSIGSVPSVAERTVTINGMSKAFAMTGWRVGYAAASGEFGLRMMRAMDALQGQMTSCITSFLYPAVRVAIRDCADETERFRERFANRAELIYGRMRQIPGMPCPKPTGAFYLFPDVSSHFGKRSHGGAEIRSDMDFASALLSEHHVAVVPGEEFGGVGLRHVRFSFACSEGQIEEGMTRVAHFVAGLR
jgi:aspartate aminotransferase